MAPLVGLEPARLAVLDLSLMRLTVSSTSIGNWCATTKRSGTMGTLPWLCRHRKLLLILPRLHQQPDRWKELHILRLLEQLADRDRLRTRTRYGDTW
jgi:hypothetical protein